MKLKKINAALGLLSVIFMLLHIGYSVYSYLAFIYDPVKKMIFAIPFIVLVCLHAVFGMLSVFTAKEGGRMDLYPKQNMRTILQRVSAALIFPLLILHINTFSLMQKCAEKGYAVFIILLIIAELVFFAAVITHIAVSVTNGLVTLGLLVSAEKKRMIDRILFVLGAVCFAVSAYAVVKVQIIMFLLS